MTNSVHLDLDGAWGEEYSPLVPSGHILRCRDWGKRLRYIARKCDIEEFYRTNNIWTLNDWFVIYGSGDFHHLAGMLIRRITDTPFTLVSFDNHPDWDIKPPYWSCGGWAARTLYTGRVNRVSVWGCGNFELQWPSRLSADWRAIRAGKFEIHAWAERQPPGVQKKFNCMTRENWRNRFIKFAESLHGQRTYVTVDIDCLRAEEAVTNWENGLFTADDVAWAIRELRKNAQLVGGDLCGAYSPPVYERRGQRFAGNWDHPKIQAVDRTAALNINLASLSIIWPAMIGEKSSNMAEASAL